MKIFAGRLKGYRTTAYDISHNISLIDTKLNTLERCASLMVRYIFFEVILDDIPNIITFVDSVLFILQSQYQKMFSIIHTVRKNNPPLQFSKLRF